MCIINIFIVLRERYLYSWNSVFLCLAWYYLILFIVNVHNTTSAVIFSIISVSNICLKESACLFIILIIFSTRLVFVSEKGRVILLYHISIVQLFDNRKVKYQVSSHVFQMRTSSRSHLLS